MDQCTNNYECLVINRSSRSNKLEDQVFWYKADSHKDFKTCCPEAWRYSMENYVEDDASDEENNSTMEEYLQAKRKGPFIRIQKTD
tara:strand:- start:298 stop:555 length:258 start_codon:yes stop_codon:yes gene_type:complete